MKCGPISDSVAVAAVCAVLAFALVPAAAAPGGAEPLERTSTLADQERVNVTIYNGSMALVHDRRRVTLERGTTPVAWRDVSANIDATSAILEDLTAPGAVSVVEQNFDFDLLKPSTLLDKYVGKQVTVIHDKPRPGEPATESATLLADNDGVVLRYADRVEASLVDSHIAFPGIPANLRDQPTLVLDLASAKAGVHELDLSYITGGLDWHADYVGVVSPNERSMDLSGLVTLSNTTGTTFADAHVQLVAGNVNSGQAPLPKQMRLMATPIPAPPNVTQENYFEYHLYTLGNPTTIANAQTKQVALLAAHGVPIRKTLEVRGADSYYSNESGDLGSKIPVGVYVTFTNKGGDLGVPLPGGLVRLYKNDSRGTSQFLGADRIDHTPKNEDVRLHLGDSFDVTVTKKQTDFKALGTCTFESAYDVRLANAKDAAQDVEVVEPLPGQWSILSENYPHVKSSSATSTWTIRVPSNASATLSYRARVKLC
jgi:hypothetical protein